MRLACLILLINLLPGLTILPGQAVEPGWEVYHGSTLVKNDYNDGDSFHVLAEGNKRRHYIFRLYFVDTPETDSRLADRLEEQAAYWEMTPEEVMALGKEAAAFTEKLLEKTPFTVYTRKHEARGQSKQNRYYAMVEIEGRFLSEVLVEKGLARIYGQEVDLPDGTSSKRHWSRLHQAERAAKKEGLGGWGMQTGQPGQPGNPAPSPGSGLALTPQDITLPRTILVYALDPPHRAIGRLRIGHKISVIKAFSPTRAQIRFTLQDGKNYEVLCNRVDLGL